MADKNYLCFTAVGDVNIRLSVNGTLSPAPSLQYSTDGITWTNYTLGTDVALQNGDAAYWRGLSAWGGASSSNYVSFSATGGGQVKASGSIMSLIDPNVTTTTIPSAHYFRNFFRDCTKLLTPPELPAATLKTYCYGYMFYGCTSLQVPPSLPAMTLDSYCYAYMFYNCTSLQTVPAFPATELETFCYTYMFYGCTSLTTLPALPALTLVNSCYRHMFRNCTGIKVSATQTGNYTIPFRIPVEGTGTDSSASSTPALGNFFAGTGGTFTGNPTVNTTYYLYSNGVTVSIRYNGDTVYTGQHSLPVDIGYNGETIASITGDGTVKTLSCAGKLMATDVTVGTKTLSCSGKVMLTDVSVLAGTT